MEIELTKMDGEFVSRATFTEIKDAFLEVYRAKGSGRGNYIRLSLYGEFDMEIYLQSVVVNDFSRYQYDGPGGPCEKYIGRYKEGTILPVLEEICNLFGGWEEEKLIKLLKSLPKPEA